MSDKLDDGYGGTLTRKCQEQMKREGASELAAPNGSEAALIRGIWVMINDIEHPHPEVAEYIPRINVASKLRTLLMAAGYEWQKPPNRRLQRPGPMNAPIANQDAMAGFSARTGWSVRPENSMLDIVSGL